MKKNLLFLSLVLATSISKAASLMPGAHVFHLHLNYQPSLNTFPPITGKIINSNPKDVLTGDNYIKVPNQFSKTIAANSLINYSVSPQPPVQGYIQWTNPIRYRYSNGSGCFIQFAWDPVEKAPEIALSDIQPNVFDCEFERDDPHDGTNIQFCGDRVRCDNPIKLK